MSGGDATAPRAGAAHARHGLGWFVIYNLIAVAAAVGLYQLVYHGSFLGPPFEATYRYMSRHMTQAVLAAAMPFFAALLVGLGYARRAARRRTREAERASREG